MVARKHDQHNIGVVVAEWSESIEILLASGIPQGEFDQFGFILHLSYKVFKHRRDVVLIKQGFPKKRNNIGQPPSLSTWGTERMKDGKKKKTDYWESIVSIPKQR